MSMGLPPPPPPGAGGPARPGAGPANPLVFYWQRVVLGNFANFRGRARRAEYWWFTLANVLVVIALGILAGAVNGLWVLSSLYVLAMVVPSVAVAVRRLHDTDKSGWFLLLGVVPFFGGLILLVLMLIDSTPGANRYGVSEKYPFR